MVMGRWEERNNEDKEESLSFGTEEGGEIRVLGSWLGAVADGRNRIKRASKLWWQVKSWLKQSKLSRRWQARVVEACVESSLLYDCQSRVWGDEEDAEMDRQVLQICVEQKKWPTLEADAEEGGEHARCQGEPGSEVGESEDRKESARKDRPCDKNGKWKDNEGCSSRVVWKTGGDEQDEGKEEKDGIILEEDAKGGGNRPGGSGEEGARQGEMEEDSERESGTHPEMGVADGTQIHLGSRRGASRKEGEGGNESDL